MAETKPNDTKPNDTKPEAEELEEVAFEMTGKKKRRPKAKPAAAEKTDAGVKEATAPSADAKTEADYAYNELLDRIFGMLNKADTTAKITRIPPPQLGRIGTKRTCIVNFKEICNALHRPAEHLTNYLQVELGAPASLDGNAQQLVVKGRFQQAHMEKVLKHYIREYVICKVCKSYDTVMEKENRLHFVKCSACNSRLSVAQIRQGFQAQIGKRKTQA